MPRIRGLQYARGQARFGATMVTRDRQWSSIGQSRADADDHLGKTGQIDRTLETSVAKFLQNASAAARSSGVDTARRRERIEFRD